MNHQESSGIFGKYQVLTENKNEFWKNDGFDHFEILFLGKSCMRNPNFPAILLAGLTEPRKTYFY